MNKKGQSPNQIFAAIVGIALIIAILPIFTNLFNQSCPACQTCDYSSYQNKILDCENTLNLTKTELDNRPIVYINQTVEVPTNKTIEKIVYKDNPVSITIISLSLLLSLSLTLFSFKIKLPKRLEQELYDIEDMIKLVKYGSLILTILIFFKLVLILFS